MSFRQSKKIAFYVVIFGIILFFSHGQEVQAAANIWQAIGGNAFTSGSAHWNSLALKPDTNEPYVAFSDADNSDKVTVMKYNGSSWSVVGSAGFSYGSADYISLAFNPSTNEPYVAFTDYTSYSPQTGLTILKFDGSSWVSVGNVLDRYIGASILHVSMAFKPGTTEPYVAFSAGGTAKAMKFNGSSWSMVGLDVSGSGGGYYTSLAFNPSTKYPYVAYSDVSAGGKVTVKYYNGSSWQAVGNTGFSSGSATVVSLAFHPTNNRPYVAFNNGANSDAQYFDDSNWIDLGTPEANTTMGGFNLLAFNPSTHEPYVICEKSDYSLSVSKYNGSSWDLVGSDGFISSFSDNVAIAFDSATVEPYVVFRNTTYNKDTLMRFNSRQEDTPDVSLAEGEYSSTQSITLSASGSDIIYYTLDGSEPTSSSIQYHEGEPIYIGTNMAGFSYRTLKAYAVKAGLRDSDVITRQYSFRAAAPSASPSSGIYSGAQEVTLSSDTPDAYIYYTTDGSYPNEDSTQYTGSPISISANTDIEAIAMKPDMENSNLSAFNFIISVNIPVATPTISPKGGTYKIVETVFLACATEGASIYYTTNGSTPTVASNFYFIPFDVLSSQTIKAIAIKPGMLDSSIASQKYKITIPTVKTPSAFPKAGTYFSPQTVTLHTGTSGATIYYTTDGSDPTTAADLYDDPITISANITIRAIAVKNGMLNSNIMNKSYKFAVANPIFSLKSGTYYEDQTVSISTATEDASIYYTTDGSIPTAESTLYDGPIEISASQNISAIAYKAGWNTGKVKTKKYTLKVAKPTATPAGDTYTHFQFVTLSTITSGAIIYYTNDGSEPTVASSVYSSPIIVFTSQTMRAIAVKTGWSNSKILKAKYKMNLPPTT